MKRKAWCLVNPEVAEATLRGVGAQRCGGRWNSPGVPMVYLSATLSLATLEALFRAATPGASLGAAYSTEFDDAEVEVCPPESLPANWRSCPAGPATQGLGDRWIRETRSLVWAVPSALAPMEFNYLLNPLHPRFPRLIMTRELAGSDVPWGRPPGKGTG